MEAGLVLWALACVKEEKNKGLLLKVMREGKMSVLWGESLDCKDGIILWSLLAKYKLLYEKIKKYPKLAEPQKPESTCKVNSWRAHACQEDCLCP